MSARAEGQERSAVDPLRGRNATADVTPDEADLQPRKPVSVAVRLFAAGAIWTTAVLLVGGITLSSYYTRSVERGFDQRLHVYLKTLVSAVADGTFGREDPGNFGEPRFDLPLSGWYWQITRLDRDAQTSTTSKSLFEEQLPRLTDAGGESVGYAQGPDNQRLRMVERTVDLGQDGRYLITIGAAAGEIDRDVSDFNVALLITFSLLGLGLVITTLFQVRFGLRPLARMGAQLSEIRKGVRARLEGAFPKEIAPLAGELNALLDSNRQIVDRARTHVGNLAHGLKTPLSVIANEASAGEGPFVEKVREQAVLMRRQIDHHLERARLSAGVAFIGETAEVKPVLEGLARTMEKIHRDRDLRVDVAAVDELRFRGERQDLEEMIGNLVDNACKWAAERVTITAEPSARKAGGNPTLHILVDDDGPGLSPEQCADVLKRGRRLDETKPGSGLGLAIVSELAGMYGGRLSLDRAPPGGLRCDLALPAA